LLRAAYRPRSSTCMTQRVTICLILRSGGSLHQKLGFQPRDLTHHPHAPHPVTHL
jgi:hypothetical protein